MGSLNLRSQWLNEPIRVEGKYYLDFEFDLKIIGGSVVDFMPSIQPVERGTLRNRVSEHLFKAMIRGHLRPGERIIEARLAKEIGVAKTTLREALQELEHRGLITKYEHRGSFVTTMSREDIENAFDVRLRLEPFAAGLASQRMTEANFEQLEDLLEKTGQARERRDFAGISMNDTAFHQFIWRCSGNKLLEATLQLVCYPLWAFELIRLFSAPRYDFGKAHKGHVTLLHALRDGKTRKEVEGVFHKVILAFRANDIRNLQLLEDGITSGDAVA